MGRRWGPCSVTQDGTWCWALWSNSASQRKRPAGEAPGPRCPGVGLQVAGAGVGSASTVGPDGAWGVGRAAGQVRVSGNA